jgi:uncharacterized protein
MKKPSKTTQPKAKTATKKAAPKRGVRAKVAEDVHKFEAAKKTKTTKPRKAAVRPATKKKAAAVLDQLGELPRSYGEERIFVVAQEPHWLFCYWDYTLTDGLGGQVFLRHTRQGAKDHEGEVRMPGETNSWYLAVREADAAYVVELGLYEDGEWHPLTRSSTVLTPRDTLAGLGDPVFANMPFHVTFQQLVEKLRGEMREGESLAEALSRLQARGDFPVGKLSGGQRVVLDTLLGTQLGSLTSGDLGRFLSSPGASLFSGGFAPSSWGAAAAPSSWTEAPGGASSGFLALFGLLGASWSGAPGSSALSSWSEFAPSSWGAESSWGLGSSWSAQPFSQPTPREFFMHVNAEVIFYGGTHPDAKVTIDGREIGLRPDGSFRYHFVFPDGEYEIPIVATSPDGQEVRRAFLRFERATGREGDVGATDQPPLAAPMGRKG